MRFENGMLGFLIVVLALGGSIFGTVLMSAEETTYDVTKYRFETEVTGLFPVDTSPDYIDYDLSSNYTGYYMEDTEINGVRYWGGATFTPTGVNNYPIRFARETVMSDDCRVIDYRDSLVDSAKPSDTTRAYFDIFLHDYNNPTSSPSKSYSLNDGYKSVTLLSLIAAMGLSDVDYIEITPMSSFDSDYIPFFSVDDWREIRPIPFLDTLYGIYTVGNSYIASYPQETGIFNILCKTCKIDKAKNTVDLYYGNSVNTNEFVKTLDLSKACVLCNPSTYGDLWRYHVEAYNEPTIQYMDTSQGVTVTGESD